MRTFRSRLGGFFPRVGADVVQLAAKQRQQLLSRPDVQKLREVRWAGRFDDPSKEAPTYYETLETFLNEIPDEGFKLFPWVVREFKKSAFAATPQERALGIYYYNFPHARDIVTQATRWIVWAKEHNKPLPDMMARDFGFANLQEWVYQMNAAQSDGDDWADSKEVYKWPDGWHMDQVGSADLPREGELMGHCVGGEGYQNAVERGDTTIFSLRDPKGHPHATIEMQGEQGSNVGRGFGESDEARRRLHIVQVQGKQDTEPIPEYRNRIGDWYDHLRSLGWEPEEEEVEREPEVEYEPHWRGAYSFEEPSNVLDYHDIMTGPERDEHFGDDEEGNWDDNNTITYGLPRELNPQSDDVRYPNFGFLARQFVEQLLSDRTPQFDNQMNGDKITKFVQGLWMAVRHANGRTWNHRGEMVSVYQDEWENCIQAAETALSEWQTKRNRAPQQETLFGQDPYFAPKTPHDVEAMIRYMEQLLSAPDSYTEDVQRPVQDETGYKRDGENNIVYETRPVSRSLVFPGEGSWPITDFANYFNAVGMPGMSMQGTFAKYVRETDLIERLVRTAHTTDWNFIPSEYEGDVECPLDGSELDIHLHGGASCPTCGSQYEVGQGNVVIPSDNTIPEMTKQWPDVLPWGESEQTYYRNAAVTDLPTMAPGIDPRFKQPDAVMENAVWKHACPMCHGYLHDRGGVYTCDWCGFEPGAERVAGERVKGAVRAQEPFSDDGTEDWTRRL